MSQSHKDADWPSKDASDPLKPFREQFIIPSRADLARKTIVPQEDEMDDQLSVYLCGNSLGLQPKFTREYLEDYLSTWAQKGVYGHFKEVSDTPLPPWLHVDDDVRADMATIVGAQTDEVAVMQTLTANLHMLMCSFYRPIMDRFKILIEGKAFPSDHFAVESQLQFHGYTPEDAMVLLEPEDESDSLALQTDYVLSVIDKHADELALILLPGIQYFTGQFFDIAKITSYAHDKGITIGWDLAHAVGNVPLELHDWDVDFAAWCTYKYLNAGPGSIGGLFVHEKHGTVERTFDSRGRTLKYQPRLAGWWGSAKESRFAMDNHFEPIPGAAGFQVSNSSVADTTALRASLDVFKQTSMQDIREKSIKLTAYLEKLLDGLPSLSGNGSADFKIITPRDSAKRGAQLSLRLSPGLLDGVMGRLEAEGIVVDERKPDVIRVAPAPLYNTFEDVHKFCKAFEKALKGAGHIGYEQVAV